MQTINRVVKLLDFLSKYKDGVGVYEISESIDLPLSTTHRMLSSLEENEFVVQDKITKKYKLGIRILSLAVNILNDMDIIKISMPIIEEISSKYGKLMFLSVLESDRVICVDMVNNAQGMKFYVQVGSHMPVYCSASGKSIVAYQDDKKIDEILESEKRRKLTKNTKLNDKDIKNDLKMVRESGYAVCDEEMELGVVALSTPIRDRHGDAFASITIMLMKHLEYDKDQIIKDLKDASAKISSYLGYKNEGGDSY